MWIYVYDPSKNLARNELRAPYAVWMVDDIHLYSTSSALDIIIATKYTCVSVSLDVDRLLHI